MDYNQSILRRGTSKARWKKNQKRFARIAELREEGYTWRRIGGFFNVSRQAVCKFYFENEKLYTNSLRRVL